jgi:Fe-S-cluster containining protein
VVTTSTPEPERQPASFYFGCSACGKCCDSAPQLSVPELFHHQHRFIGCLSLRRVRRLRTGARLADGSLANAEDEAALRSLAERIFCAPPGDSDHDLFLFTRAFADGVDPVCPALDAGGHCAVHDDRKPGVCRVVPLEATLPDRLQRVVLDLRRRERGYDSASCIAVEPVPGGREVTRRLRVVDPESFSALERRRDDLAAEREFWGVDAFRLLAPELLRAGYWETLPEDGHFTIAIVPVLTVISGVSPRCRERVIEYLHVQAELIQQTLLTLLSRRDPRDQAPIEQLRAFLRAGDAFTRVVESAPPRTWSASTARAERVEAWLGV